MPRVIRIERTKPRPGKVDCAYRSKRGFMLGDPTVTSDQRKRAVSRKFAATLDEAAFWVERGWHLRMGDTWQEASLIQPANIRIVRVS